MGQITLQELGKLSHKLAEISSKADNMAAAIDDLQKYSFQYNVKIVGIPNPQENHETAEATVELCVKLDALRAFTRASLRNAKYKNK